MPKKILKKNYLKKKLDKIKFKNIKIIQCNFWEASLKNTLFENVEILDSVFTDADLSGAKFSNTIIKNSNFSHAIITGCDFSKCKFVNINLREAIYDSKTKWPKNFDLKKHKMFNLKEFNPYDYNVKMSMERVKKLKEFKKKFFNKIKKNKIKTNNIVQKIVKELTYGKGYYIFKNLYSKTETKIAEKLINIEIKKTKNYKQAKVNYSTDKRLKYIVIHKLLNMDKVFVKMIQPDLVMEAFKKLMGRNFFCTWFAAQCSLPETRGQNLHLDYPYVKANYPNEKIPIGMGGSKFLLSCGILTYINDSDKSNYGPIVLDHSHKKRKYPSIDDVKNKKFKRLKIPRGGALIFNSLIWHAGMPNYSQDKIRTLLVAHYTPDFIQPRYNLKNETRLSIIKKDQKYLKQLIV